MMSGIFYVYDTEHILSSLKFRMSAFHSALKASLSIKYGFALLILIAHLKGYRHIRAQLSLACWSCFMTFYTDQCST